MQLAPFKIVIVITPAGPPPPPTTSLLLHRPFPLLHVFGPTNLEQRCFRLKIHFCLDIVSAHLVTLEFESKRPSWRKRFSRQEHKLIDHEFRLVLTCTNMSRDTTKPTKWLCAQRRLRSAWTSAQSDQHRCHKNSRNLNSPNCHLTSFNLAFNTGVVSCVIWHLKTPSSDELKSDI